MKTIHSFEPLFGNWTTDELIGEGSFGKVYVAYRDTIGEREYSAIKHISIPKSKADYDNLKYELNTSNETYLLTWLENQKDQVLSEYRMQSRFKGYTQFVDCQDIAVIPKRDDETPGYDIFIRMEKLDNLAKVSIGKRMNPQETAKLGIDVCKALELLKKENLIHRDLKPQNIFISKNGDYKVGDFGTARSLPSGSVLMSVTGTTGFMAPEIARGESAGFAADLYSLGMVLYRQINGSAPFVDTTNSMLSTQTTQAEIRRLTGEPIPDLENIPHELNRIIKKACEFNKQNRYQSAEEMRSDLENFLGLRSQAPQKDAEQKPPEKQEEVLETPPEKQPDSSRNTSTDEVSRNDKEYHFHFDYLDRDSSSSSADSTINERKLRTSVLIATLCLIAVAIIIAILAKVNTQKNPKSIVGCGAQIVSAVEHTDTSGNMYIDQIHVKVTASDNTVLSENTDYTLTVPTQSYLSYETDGKYHVSVEIKGINNYCGAKGSTLVWVGNRKQCSDCGYYSASDAVYCGMCGKKLK